MSLVNDAEALLQEKAVIDFDRIQFLLFQFLPSFGTLHELYLVLESAYQGEHQFLCDQWVSHCLQRGPGWVSSRASRRRYVEQFDEVGIGATEERAEGFGLVGLVGNGIDHERGRKTRRSSEKSVLR